MDAKSLKALEAAEIIKFRGISGIETTAEIAMQAPELVQVVAMSGKTYDLGRNGDSYLIVERFWKSLETHSMECHCDECMGE